MANISTQLRVKLIAAALTLLAVAGINAQAEEEGEAADRIVTVCIASGITQESGYAQAIAGKMFAEIGVRINWHPESKCPSNDGVIHIALDTGMPTDRFPGAWAIARPYEGVHIKVFVNRFRRSVAPNIMPTLLAHVLAHEITHLLQGISRHSDSGVLKATWDQKDFEKMALNPLNFTDLDVKLIHLGLDARTTGRARINHLAANSAQASAVQ